MTVQRTQQVLLQFDLGQSVCAGCIADLVGAALASHMESGEVDDDLKGAILSILCLVPEGSPIGDEHLHQGGFEQGGRVQ